MWDLCLLWCCLSLWRGLLSCTRQALLWRFFVRNSCCWKSNPACIDSQGLAIEWQQTFATVGSSPSPGSSSHAGSSPSHWLSSGSSSCSSPGLGCSCAGSCPCAGTWTSFSTPTSHTAAEETPNKSCFALLCFAAVATGSRFTLTPWRTAWAISGFVEGISSGFDLQQCDTAFKPVGGHGGTEVGQLQHLCWEELQNQLSAVVQHASSTQQQQQQQALQPAIPSPSSTLVMNQDSGMDTHKRSDHSQGLSSTGQIDCCRRSDLSQGLSGANWFDSEGRNELSQVLQRAN